MQNIIAIIGSASADSSSHKIVQFLNEQLQDSARLFIFDRLKEIPHFDPVESINQPPIEIVALRQIIQDADVVLICTPEYIFSVPSGLKNLLEWCVASTVWMDKPVGIVTASADGEKGHAELQRILQTLGAAIRPETSLHIRGIKSKIDATGQIQDDATRTALMSFMQHLL
ncbi:NADPH-dependent FMN reductase [Sphingobacterium sp. SYP-B4668]|uniref:NADPH-dependent FMN reductase n=1 Tax=Sphingobacterium sp. SYP-B4668 TaxID=2996035 RepID=UPI0022DDB57C|nr:NADPH-dependent FMN reductase [Sphingobacterium sp. SYP-B4668]